LLKIKIKEEVILNYVNLIFLETWTEQEDKKILKLIKKFGPAKWAQIARHMKGRIGKQCRERWHNHLKPNIKRTPWTEEEEFILFLVRFISILLILFSSINKSETIGQIFPKK